MKALLALWGIAHLLNAVIGILSGRISFITKTSDQFFPGLHSAERDNSALFFWMVVLGNLVFGGFLLGFSITQL